MLLPATDPVENQLAEERLWQPLLTLEELAARPDQEVEWYAPYWIPVGAKTILCAPPKCGKTILMFHMLKSVLDGVKFCGQQCVKQKVMYLTEQTEYEFKRQIKEIPGLLGNPNMYVLLAENFPEELHTWKMTLQWIDKMMKAVGANILVVDTFLSYAKLPDEGENDSATIQNALNDMNFLFKTPERAVVLCHHSKKKPDEDRYNKYDPLALESIRGSSAFSGGAGHIVLMHAPSRKSTERRFNFVGRYTNGQEMSMNLINHEYLLTQLTQTHTL